MSYLVTCRAACGFEEEVPSIEATPVGCPECGAGIHAEVTHGEQ